MSDRTLDIALLRTLHMAGSLGTLRATAARRHCTLGAVSQQIKRLEQQLDCQLLVRFKTGVQLTAEGEQLIAQSLTLLAEHDALVERLSHRSAQGVVRIGMPNEYVPRMLDNLLPALRQTVPQVRLQVTTANSLELRRSVTQGELDMAIALYSDREDQAPGPPLWRTRPVWAGSIHGGLHRRDPLPLALHPCDCTYRAIALAALNDNGRSWETVFASTSVAAIESAVANGLAVSVLNRSRLTGDMQVLGAREGFPPLPECLACLIESPDVATQNRAAVDLVKNRLQSSGLIQQVKWAG
ncbi:LysR substrate-binding domain-containing protein [Kushneria indalinina]|uniref:LysR family transcriptional regulator n=1 Tax=Kushneria indalinina DSM 14324 TaxID=1122140 RepID=A0A3D9DW21_9GAMM|nr:LysR substrate-binding domain-containing protein [Kushneria indalinina]REC94983.1 LysR family transcriptional regulator [Kushneria indalinina DSM 14324]